MKASQMAAAEEAQNEASVQNLVHVENSAVQGSVTCPAPVDARSTGIRPHPIFGARDRDEGSQPSRPKEQKPAALRQIPKAK